MTAVAVSRRLRMAAGALMRFMRHPFTGPALVAVVAAGAVVAVMLLAVIPLLNAISTAPVHLTHAYANYWNDVGQQVAQAKKTGG